ncbi:MAG: 3-dehydroquinate synthase [Bdellovibrionales bacterium]|nr:3-dehydroquinate synthase [Bdellovibrionales bacterium]
MQQSPTLQECPLEKSECVLFYDSALKALPAFEDWQKDFLYHIELTGGESLKSFEQFKSTLEELGKGDLSVSLKKLKFVAVGGGSVGDFVGFIASIYKRGVELIQIPSTWLSAIDSAHGGKTALNFFSAKNQIGTFYPATQIFLVDEILQSQPEDLAQQSVSEIYKIMFIDGTICSVENCLQKPEKFSVFIDRYLMKSIEAKYKIVLQDPFEKTGLRQVLNLGHTLGHILESHFGLSHGEAVARGLIFALKWSHDRYKNPKLLEYAHRFEDIFSTLSGKKLDPVSESEFVKIATKDKKWTAAKALNFVFVKDYGDCTIEEVSLDEFISEGLRQGIVKSE